MVTLVVILFLWGLGGAKGCTLDAQMPYEDVGNGLVVEVLDSGGIVFGSFFECVSEFELTRLLNWTSSDPISANFR